MLRANHKTAASVRVLGMSSEKIKAIKRKIMETSEKEKRADVLLSGEVLNILEDDVSN